MCFVRERGIEENPFDESDSGDKIIQSKIGDNLYFSFYENPTTGFSIIVDNTTIAGSFNYTKNYSLPLTYDNPPALGVGRKVYFKITPLKVGSTTFRVVYARPWENKKAWD